MAAAADGLGLGLGLGCGNFLPVRPVRCFVAPSGVAQTTSDSILGVIRKESWILDHFEIFVTIPFSGA